MISQVLQTGPEGLPVLSVHHLLRRLDVQAPLSLHDVEDLPAERGVIVSHESIRVWCQRFRTQIATKIRRDRPIPADEWHLDEVVIPIRGKKHWLWRAVDANDDVLEILVQSRRNARSAKRFLKCLMKRWGVPRVLVPPSRDSASAIHCRAADKLRSYGVAVRGFYFGVDHRSHKGLNNRSEASHRHTRRREKIMGHFNSLRQAQRFLSLHDQTTTIFRPKRHCCSATSHRHARADTLSLE